MFKVKFCLPLSSFGPVGIKLASVQGLIVCYNGKVVGLSVQYTFESCLCYLQGVDLGQVT